MALKTLNRRNKKDLKWPKIIIAILSTIGIVDTGSITLKNWGLFTSLSCPGIKNGCETVLSSPWGIPQGLLKTCLLYTSPSPRDKRQSRMPSSA